MREELREQGETKLTRFLCQGRRLLKLYALQRGTHMASWQTTINLTGEDELIAKFKFNEFTLGPFVLKHWENTQCRFSNLKSIASAVIMNVLTSVELKTY